MNIPGFTADRSLRRSGVYRRDARAGDAPASGIIPAKDRYIIVKEQKTGRVYLPVLGPCLYGGFLTCFDDGCFAECAPPPRGDFAR